MTQPDVALLGPAEVRALAAEFAVRPTKKLGQNFVHDPNTVRRIVQLADVGAEDVVLEVGPGLGSLTLGLLATGASVVAVEVDPVLAERLPATVRERAGSASARLTVLAADALRLHAADLAPATAGDAVSHTRDAVSDARDAVSDARDAVSGPPDAVSGVPDAVSGVPDAVSGVPDAVSSVPDTPSPAAPNLLVANLPYNVAVPVVLHLLGELPSLRRALVMVQTEVADRMAAGPGSRVYGVPSVKLAWYGATRKVAPVPRAVFWPVPNVDSALIAFERHPGSGPLPADARDRVFAVVDAAFAQRRKTLRAALASWAGSAQRAEQILRAAGVDPATRGEQLTVTDFTRIATTSPP